MYKFHAKSELRRDHIIDLTINNDGCGRWLLARVGRTQRRVNSPARGEESMVETLPYRIWVPKHQTSC
jgi:hypothetical protein